MTHEDKNFEIAHGRLVFPEVGPEFYQAVFDFGCGCGRVARQLMCQTPKPERYLGIDIHRGMIDWCQRNLTAFDPDFKFLHHDVYNIGLGPDNTRQATTPFPACDAQFSLVIAHSVFTHLYKEQSEFYLAEIERILQPGGLARTTWFLFDKCTFPMMFDFQVCLFINEVDPSNAVIYDWHWLLDVLQRKGLRVTLAVPPAIRGHQWQLFLQKARGVEPHNFPTDVTTLGALCGSGLAGKSIPAPPEEEPTEPAAKAEEAPPQPVNGIVQESSPTAYRLHFSSSLSESDFLERTKDIEWWYHSYYFDNGFKIRGDYNIGVDIAAYGFPASMHGMRVLDVGTGAGWFAHYFAEKGAEVTTVDARGYEDFDVYGRHRYPPIDPSVRRPDRFAEDGNPVYDSPVSRGFWIMKAILNSNIRFRNSRIYELSPEQFGGETFDLVFLGAILCHVRDPIGALMAARSVCRSKVMATVPVVIGEPASETLPRQYLPYTEIDKISWWLPNEACFRHWFLAAGFTSVDVSRQIKLTCDVERLDERGKPANGDQILRIGTAYAF